MYKNNRIRPLKTLQYYLGPPTDHNTYEAEACGALFALWILENTPETIRKKMSLYLDNQAVIKAIKSNNANSCQQLIQHIRMALGRFSPNLSINWILSHCQGTSLAVCTPFIYPIYCSYSTFISLCLHICLLLFGYDLTLCCSQYTLFI